MTFSNMMIDPVVVVDRVFSLICMHFGILICIAGSLHLISDPTSVTQSSCPFITFKPMLYLSVITIIFAKCAYILGLMVKVICKKSANNTLAPMKARIYAFATFIFIWVALFLDIVVFQVASEITLQDTCFSLGHVIYIVCMIVTLGFGISYTSFMMYAGLFSTNPALVSLGPNNLASTNLV